MGAGAWATGGVDGVTTALGAADGVSTRASCFGAVRLATTSPVTTAVAATTTSPMAVSFQSPARLRSVIGRSSYLDLRE